MKGMEMMFKAALDSAGIDPKKIIADYNQFISGVTATLDTLDKRMAHIEKMQEQILKMQGEIWQKIMGPDNQPLPQHTAQLPAKPLPQLPQPTQVPQ